MLKNILRTNAIGIYLLAIFLCFKVYSDCNFNTSQYIENLKDPKNLISIDINIPDSKKWNKNLLKITLDRSSNINPKFRDKFNANVKVNYKFGSCTHKARVRISGDWKDHIQFNNGFFKTSLDVRLADGNILNSVRFKLLIPETRNSINEIFGSLLLKQFGFISPETFYVDANINDSKGLYLFQEMLQKKCLKEI